MCNIPRLGLEEEQQIAILLCLFIIWEKALLQICGIFEVACDFILLRLVRIDFNAYV